MDKKNYYKILNLTEEDKKLPKSEFEKKIKENYRKIAIKYHPDKNPGNKDAEEKFKEAAEAYSVLSDEQKRKEYDNPVNGGNQFKYDFNFSDFNIDEILNSFGFGGRNGFNSSRKVVYRGSNIRLKMYLSLKEMYDGVKKKIKYHRNDKCEKCDGKGTTKDSKVERCKHCGGTGKLYSRSGIFQQITTCHYCGGTGSVTTNPCHKCNGNGVIDTVQEVEIDIPKGAFQGMQLTIHGYGHAPKNMNGQFGDLLIDIYEKSENDGFERDGNNLLTNIEVPVIDAILGCDITVKTINGKKLKAKINGGTEDGHTMRFSGYGMPIYGSNGFGDLFVVIKIKMPKTINNDERKVLMDLKEKNNFK